MSRHSEQQIIDAVKRVEAGKSMVSVCFKMGISLSTLYRWRKKYADFKSNSERRARADDAKYTHKAKSNESKRKSKADDIKPAPKVKADGSKHVGYVGCVKRTRKIKSKLSKSTLSKG